MKGLIDSSLLILCENIQSEKEEGGGLNTDTSRLGSAGEDKKQPVERHNAEKLSPVVCLHFFMEDFNGRSARSVLKSECLALRLFSRRLARLPANTKGLSPDHPAEGDSFCSQWAATLLQYLLSAVWARSL